MAPSLRCTSLAPLLLLAAVSVSDGQTVVNEVEPGLFLLLADFTEPCTTACLDSGYTCSYESLEAGNPYGSSTVIAGTIASIGGECDKIRTDRTGKAFPLIDDRGHCFGSAASRTNFKCDFVSTMTHPGRRICSCFGEPGTPPPTASPVSTPAPTESTNSGYVPEGYTLSWSDEFDGPDLDTNNWSRGLEYDVDPTQHVLWNPNEGGPRLLNSKYHGYILDEDSYIQDGKLMLANREHVTPIQGTEPPGSYQYSSGWINSLRKRFINGSNKAVYVKLRAKFPEGPKVWPAVWFVSEDDNWPPEIDIWEYFGVFFNEAAGVDEMHFRNIWGHWQDKQTHTTEINWHQNYPGFSVLGWIWTSHEMIWYVNGEEVERKVRGVDIPDEGWPNQDMSLILNNGLMSEVGADLVANGVATSFPNYLEVDYISVHENPNYVPPPTESPTPVPTPDPNGYTVHLGEVGESCTVVCARVGGLCTTESLAHGDAYSTSSGIQARAAEVGVTCNGVHGEFPWNVNPQVSITDYCFPNTEGRTNQDCDADEDGQLEGRRICTCEQVATFLVVLGYAGESCTSACSRNGAQCTVDALVHGDLFTTNTTMAATALTVGASCDGGMHDEKSWAVNPQLSSENYCFPTVTGGRSTQDCDTESTLTDTATGELDGHRICTCETSTETEV